MKANIGVLILEDLLSHAKIQKKMGNELDADVFLMKIDSRSYYSTTQFDNFRVHKIVASFIRWISKISVSCLVSTERSNSTA